jgi:AraC-like DNA-binding protein
VATSFKIVNRELEKRAVHDSHFDVLLFLRKIMIDLGDTTFITRDISLTDCNSVHRVSHRRGPVEADRMSEGRLTYLKQRRVGSLTIGVTDATSFESVRQCCEVSRASEGDFLISLLAHGSGSIEQDGRATHLGAGQIALLDLSQSFADLFSKDLRLIFVRVPRRQLLARLPEAERMTAVALNGRTSLGAFINALIRSVTDLDSDLDPCAASIVASSIIEIFAAIANEELGYLKDVDNRRVGLLERAKRFMEQNLGDTELDVEKISSAMAVSRRTLNRIFAAHGITATQWLWSKRIEASHVLLREGNFRHVGDVAVACGFVDISHFGRVFKKKYGVPPGSFAKHRA